MAYAVISDVQGLNAKRTVYSASTAPTATQVTQFIAQISAEIDAVLAQNAIATPVTSPASYLVFLGLVNAWGAAALAEAAAFPEFDGGPANTPQSMRYWGMYQSALKGINDGTMIDPATAGSGSDTLARTYRMDNTDDLGFDGSDGFTDGQQPAFSMKTSGVDY